MFKNELDEEQKKILKKDGYELIEIFRETKNKKNVRYIKVKHLFCGKVYSTRLSKFFTENQRCTCQRKIKYAKIKNTSDFQNFLNNKFGNNEYIALTDYKGRKKEIKLKHNCGWEYLIKRAEFIMDDTGGRCPICTPGSINNKEILELKIKRYGSDLSLLEPFETGKLNYKFKNNKCGHIYYMRTYDLLRKNPHGCPICSLLSAASSEEISLKNFIEEDIGIATDKIRINIEGSKRKNLEADIYIKDKRLGFEYNGIYWHSDLFRNKNYHKNKTFYFNSNNIQLYHIFSDDWLYKTDIIKSNLRRILNKSLLKTVDINSCIIREISRYEKNIFLEENSLKGKDKSNKYIGTFYNNVLVSILTLNINKKISNNATIVSYIIKKDYYINDMLKLYIKFIRNTFNLKILYKSIDISFPIDLEEVIENNFELTDVKNPDYTYINLSSVNFREPKSKYTRSKLKAIFPDIYSDSKSKREIMKEAGYSRIYDCGNLVYTLSL